MERILSLNKIMVRIWVVLSIVLFTSCAEKPFDEEVFEAYQKCEDKASCELDFNEAFGDKEWEWMYVLQESVTDRGVRELTGIDYDGNKDMSRLLLLVKDDKIIFEQSDLSVENPYEINFDRNNPYKYHYSNALFKIEKEEGYYYLTHISEEK